MSGLPGWLRALASRLVRGPNAEFILQDIAEDHARRAAHGRTRAALRTLRLILASAWAVRPRRSRPHPARAAADLALDARFALRDLRNRPGFALVAVLTLALGIGANAAVFSVVHGVLLAPLPYAHPDRVVNLWQVFYEWQDSEVPLFRQMADRFRVSWPTYEEWSGRSRSFEAIAVYDGYPTIVDGIELPEWVNVVQTTRSLADVLGVGPELGRWFAPDEDRAGGDRVAVLSHRYWQRLGGETSILGASLRLHGNPYTVVGVMPEGFYFPSRAHDIWIPVPAGRRNDRFTSQSMAAVGLLAEGVTIATARREMDAIAAQIIADFPHAIDAGVRLVPRVDEVAGSAPRTLQLLGFAVGLVLLVAGANVGGLLLLRASARRQELAMRAALGAGRGRLTRQLITEGAVLAAAGGLVALAVLSATLGALRSALPVGTPRVEDVTMGWPVVLFVVAVAGLVATLFGLASAVHLRRHDPTEWLQHGARGVVGWRARSALVVTEIAVSVVLLAVAALLGLSYGRLAATPSGLRAEGVLSLRVAAPIDLWHDHEEELRAFAEAVSERLGAVPGVRAVSAVSNLPFSGSRSSGGFGLVADPAAPEHEGWSLEQAVSPEYFEVMGIPIVAGRTLAGDADGPAEIVVSETLAARYFPGRSPIGETLWEEGSGAHQIVGVAADVHHGSLDEEVDPARYRLFARSVDARASWVLRVDGDPAAITDAVRLTLRSAAPGTTVSELATMTDLIRDTTALPRFRSLLLAGLAGLAALLAALGLYGIVAASVSARRREFGLRVTLGADAARVVALVLGDGLRLALPGVAIGVAGAVVAARWLASFLHGTDPGDPVALVGAATAGLALSLLALLVPAARALRVDPATALRGV